MDDTISRRSAIESVDMLFRPFTEYSPGMVDLAGVACNHTLADVIATLKALPSAEQWIPVTERLPEKDGRYLITGKRGTVYSLEYEDERWYGGIQPIAWMPLPTPYKGGEEE